jgi:sugar phosphate permease
MSKAYRWKARYSVLSILFVVSVVSFMDRIAISIAIPSIAADYRLSPMQMGLVMSTFYAGYALTQIPGGLLADMFGVRKVATLAMLWWSAFTAVTGAAANLAQMLIARLLFGLGEGMFPACAFKTISIWFPKKERATATAILLSSNSFGAALAPLAVVGIISLWGWRVVFYSLLLPGVLMSLLFWTFITDKPSESRRVSAVELLEIDADAVVATETCGAKVKLVTALSEPKILKCFLILFTFDITLSGFTTWLPTYLVKARGFSMAQMGVAASPPFLAGAAGSILAGWLSDKYFSNDRRVPVIAGQLVSAFLLYLTFTATSTTMVVICEILDGFWLMFSVSAVWALPMSIVPKQLMGVTGGFINVAGQVAAFISPIVIGYLVGSESGSFGHAFVFLVVSALVSCALVFTLPSGLQYREEEPV